MDRIMRKIYNFLSFFIPFFYLIGVFILIVTGVMLVEELHGIVKYFVAIGILFMTFGIIGKHFQDSGMDEIIKKDMRKRMKKGDKAKRKWN